MKQPSTLNVAETPMYRYPLGLPLRWQDETSGIVNNIVRYNRYIVFPHEKYGLALARK